MSGSSCSYERPTDACSSDEYIAGRDSSSDESMIDGYGEKKKSSKQTTGSKQTTRSKQIIRNSIIPINKLPSGSKPSDGPSSESSDDSSDGSSDDSGDGSGDSYWPESSDIDSSAGEAEEWKSSHDKTVSTTASTWVECLNFRFAGSGEEPEAPNPPTLGGLSAVLTRDSGLTSRLPTGTRSSSSSHVPTR